ncbi:low molecular weight protein-tyrosine-phosphatase [Robiginitalea sp. IMCC43444]|uniref:low molecular weight protein-tyrosine-phosphatase n=1 Tax=Robiginitalea sp. IMCC43444 TaxID=3459121 RepID=UPI004042E079
MPVRVLMVCLGNICRSPLAEGILASKTTTESVIVDSAGTAGYHVGNPPDPRSIAVALENGIDISNQRCRRFSQSDFENFDYIFAMDRSNLSDLQALARNREELSKLSLILDRSGMPTKEVPDPYYGGEDGFKKVYDLLDQACEDIKKQLQG